MPEPLFRHKVLHHSGKEQINLVAVMLARTERVGQSVPIRHPTVGKLAVGAKPVHALGGGELSQVNQCFLFPNKGFLREVRVEVMA